jgi:hypothetical protein
MAELRILSSFNLLSFDLLLAERLVSGIRHDGK